MYFASKPPDDPSIGYKEVKSGSGRSRKGRKHGQDESEFEKREQRRTRRAVSVAPPKDEMAASALRGQQLVDKELPNPAFEPVNLENCTMGDNIFDKSLKNEPYYHGFMLPSTLEWTLKRDGDFIVAHIIQHVATERELVAHYLTSREALTKDSNYVLKNPVARPHWILCKDFVKLVGRLGAGAYGKVYKAETTEGRIVAVKSINLETCKDRAREQSQKAEFLQEAALHLPLKHRHIIEFIGLASLAEPLFFVIDFAPGGTLIRYLRKNAGRNEKQQLVRFVTEAAAAYRFLEKHKYLHRDIAARNCLLGKDNTVKVSDFGLAVVCHEEKIVEPGLKLGIRWLAPETLKAMEFSKKTDVWAFGVMMFEIFSDGSEPYTGKKVAEVRQGLTDGSMLRCQVPPNTPPDVKELMQSCWTEDPAQRPTFRVLHKKMKAILGEDPKSTTNSVIGQIPDETPPPPPLSDAAKERDTPCNTAEGR
ncbi:unnamed protein product, partial [Mesorhabditis spiculigera]